MATEFTPGEFDYLLTDRDHFVDTPTSNAAARQQIQDMLNDMLGIHNADLIIIAAAIDALVLEALGLTEGCINNSNLFAAGVVALAAMAANSVDSDQYVDGSIDLEHLADGILAASTAGRLKMGDGFITAAKLASDAVETAKIKDANVTTAKIKDANVTLAKFNADIPLIETYADELSVPSDLTDYADGTLFWWPEA
jgi:osmotically-inducible protein OsmY